MSKCTTETETDAAAAQAGDRPATARLVAHYRAYAGSIARRVGAPEVEDAIQDGMIGLLHAIRTYSPARDCPFDTYARAKLRFAILDSMRGEDVDLVSMDDDAPDSERLHETIADLNADSPEDVASCGETWRRIFALPTAQRQVLVARLGGRPAYEIARDRCVSEGRISQLVSRAVAAL